MIFAITLTVTILTVVFAILSKEKDVRFFFIMFSFSMILYLLNTIFEINEIYNNYPSEIYDNLSDFIGNLPILIFLVIRVIRDSRMLKKESRNIFIVGAVVASSGFVLIGIIATRLALFVGVPWSDFVLYMPFLVEIISIMVLLMTLYIIYMELSFRYYIIALLAGFFFSFVGDTYQLFYGLFDDISYRAIARIFDLLAFSYFLVILIWVRGQKIIISSLTEIEEEREKYKSLYTELNDKVRDLLILTQLLRHDLGNDIVVASNALDLYNEKKSKNFLQMAKRRLDKMEDRISKLRSTSEVYSSLKIQPIPISTLNEIAKLFENVHVKINEKQISIKGNQLVNFILFNIIENSFSHGGDNVEVFIESEAKNENVVIKIKDTGIGMSKEQKDKIFTQITTLDEEQVLPKGIGLNLAKTTIQNLGGKMVIEDNKPQGTTVIVELPIFEEKEK
jgi:signal transduction histidine kinase